MESTLFLPMMLWTVGFPFLYGQLFSRLFGLKKKIDHWILFCLHNSTVLVGGIIGVFAEVGVFAGIKIQSHWISILIIFVLHFGFNALVWQLMLRDRKMNGIIISLICSSIFILPYVCYVIICSF